MWIKETKSGKFKFTERYLNAHNESKYVCVTLKSNSAQAQKKATQILTAKIEAILSAPEPQYDDVSFNKLSDQWIDLKKKSVKPSTITNYQGHLKQINNIIGKIEINKLTAGAVNRMFLDMFNKGNSYKTVFERGKIIKNIIKFALEYDYLDEDLITNKIKIEKINVSEKDDNNYLEKDEATYVFEKMIDDGYCIRQSKKPQNRDLVYQLNRD